MSDVNKRLETAAAKHKAGRIEDAEAMYRHILADHPSHAEAHHMLGVVYLQKSRPADALASLRQAITIDPTDKRYHNNLGHAFMLLKKPAEAAQAFEAALERDTNFDLARFNRGTALMELSRFGEAEREFRAVLANEPDNTDALMNLGVALLRQRRAAEALDCFQLVRDCHPDDPGVWFNLAMAYDERIDLDGAREALETAIGLKPDFAEAHARLTILKHTHEPGNWVLDVMEQMLRDPETTGNTRTLLLFGLGTAYDRAGDCDRAFKYYAEANETKRKTLTYDFREDQVLMQRIIAKFDRSFFKTSEVTGDESNVPIFVVGMPRSGKTIVEQILASHPQVHGAGETRKLRELVNDLPRVLGTEASFPECMDALTPAQARDLGRRCVASLRSLAFPGASRVVNTLPRNSYYLGFIQLILPRARVIHCVRDPLDTCLYCYFKNFRGVPYTFDLTQLGDYFVHHQRLMDHWRKTLSKPPLEVRYESVVDDPFAESRRIFQFCGLDWNDAFQSDAGQCDVGTFPIPLRDSEIGRSRQYSQHLAPLARILDAGRSA